MYQYEDGQSLEDSLYAAIHIYEDSRSAYLLGDQDEASLVLHEGLDRIGSLALKAADEMVVPDDLRGAYARGGTIKHALEGLGRARDIVVERLQIDLAFRFSTDVEGRAERCLELTELLLHQPPSEAVTKYLRHLSRCYVDGAYPECVILCRAVLENAVRDKFLLSSLPLPAAEGQRSEMATRLRFARQVGWLTEANEMLALTVWRRGSKAAHDDPDVTTDVLGTVGMVMAVLKDLYK